MTLNCFLKGETEAKSLPSLFFFICIKKKMEHRYDISITYVTSLIILFTVEEKRKMQVGKPQYQRNVACCFPFPL